MSATSQSGVTGRLRCASASSSDRVSDIDPVRAVGARGLRGDGIAALAAELMPKAREASPSDPLSGSPSGCRK